jgi:hypothetical protein
MVEAWLDVGVGVGQRLRSNGKRKGRPTAGTLQTMLVPSIGLLFQA